MPVHERGTTEGQKLLGKSGRKNRGPPSMIQQRKRSKFYQNGAKVSEKKKMFRGVEAAQHKRGL